MNIIFDYEIEIQWLVYGANRVGDGGRDSFGGDGYGNPEIDIHGNGWGDPNAFISGDGEGTGNLDEDLTDS